ncbi:MAG: hypothetical protein WCT12_09530 [Verrucomicrobiota bacterium]
MKQTQAEKQKYYEEYRAKRLNAGWSTFYRLLPSDLASELSRIIVKHKAEHWDVWQSMKNQNKV